MNQNEYGRQFAQNRNAVEEHLWVPPKQTKCSANTAPGLTQGGHLYKATTTIPAQCVNCLEINLYVCGRCSYSVPAFNLLRGAIVGIPKCLPKN